MRKDPLWAIAGFRLPTPGAWRREREAQEKAGTRHWGTGDWRDVTGIENMIDVAQTLSRETRSGVFRLSDHAFER